MPDSLYDIPEGCICQGDGLMGMKCTATKHATLRVGATTKLVALGRCPLCGDELAQFTERIREADNSIASEIVTVCVDHECKYEERRPVVGEKG